jgi:hypothetical protein
MQYFINLEILIVAVNQGLAFHRWGPIIASGLPYEIICMNSFAIWIYTAD